MGRGLSCAMLCLFVSLCAAGQQYKWVDLAPPRPTGATGDYSGLGIHEVCANGSFSMAGGAPVGASSISGSRIYSPSSGWSDFYADIGAICTNSHGDFGYNGATVNGNYSYQAGGTIHYADGHEAEVPRPAGYSYSRIQNINDSGLLVGHYSFFDPFGFNYGLPFYIRNNVIYHGSMITSNWGTFVGVDRNGYGLLYDGSAAWWSPETGRIPVPGLSLDLPYYNRPDFNDHFTVVAYSHLYSGGISFYSPTSFVDLRRASFITSYYNEVQVGGLNNSGAAVCSYWRQINGSPFQYHWTLWADNQWTDLFAAVKSQIPTGWQFGEVKDIDDFGRVYGTMKRQDGTYTIVRLDPVPESTTLAALGLGALLLRRKKSASNRAA